LRGFSIKNVKPLASVVDAMQPSREKSLALLRRSLERVGPLSSLERYSALDHDSWERSARRSIAFAFGENSPHLKEFGAALKPYTDKNTLYAVDKANAFRKVSSKVSALLQAMIEEIEDLWEQDPAGPVTNGTKRDQSIFIIHGHDVGAKEELARFLSKLGLNPIILHEQPTRGKTIIEKFEEYATVPFAIALLTPDDIGAANADRERVRPRPRQNVLFEFGYFIGKLGRQHVCGLVKGDLEIPSDYSGILYIDFDSGGAWKLDLLKELRAAEFQVDANAAL